MSVGFPRASDSSTLDSTPVCVMGVATAGSVINALTMGRALAAGQPITNTLAAGLILDLGAGLGASLASASAVGDASAVIQGIAVQPMVYNHLGGVLDRMREPAADGMAVTGLSGTGGMVYNGATWDRVREVSADAQPAVGIMVIQPVLLNGASWDRARSNSAAILSATTQPFGALVAEPGEWTVTHTPAAATKATASKGAGAAGVRHVARSVHASYTGTVAGAPILVNLRDGATGAGTILMSAYLAFDAANKADRWSVAGLNVFGSAATAMTLEFVAAGVAATNQSVTLSGYSTI